MQGRQNPSRTELAVNGSVDMGQIDEHSNAGRRTGEEREVLTAEIEWLQEQTCL